MRRTADEIAMVIDDLRAGISDDPTMAQCRTASEAMKFAAELIYEMRAALGCEVDA